MKKKVFVSGCFDMLHSGHVAFFKEAASYGDLYVGIGSDTTIEELKGRKTINSEQERLYLIDAIRYVKRNKQNEPCKEEVTKKFRSALNVEEK